MIRQPIATTEPVASAPAEPLLVAEGLGVRLDGRWILSDIDLTLRPGEVVSLIGPNGAGKTTLVRALLGLIPAGRGRLRQAPDLTIGYVPQKLHIDPTLPLTVGRLMTLVRSASRAEIAEALDATGVGHLAGRMVQALSGGELQRVLLARAILHRPRLLVLDEPVQGVDYAGEAALYRLIGAERDRLGCGVLMVSHDLHVVMGSTDRVICLNSHVCCSGAPLEVSRHPEYHRLFGARAADAYAVYEHHHNHHHHADGEIVAGAVCRHDHAHDHGNPHDHHHDHHHGHRPVTPVVPGGDHAGSH